MNEEEKKARKRRKEKSFNMKERVESKGGIGTWKLGFE
jgi:hypothetical protein